MSEAEKPIMCDACKVKEASLWWCADCDSDHKAYIARLTRDRDEARADLERALADCESERKVRQAAEAEVERLRAALRGCLTYLAEIDADFSDPPLAAARAALEGK